MTKSPRFTPVRSLLTTILFLFCVSLTAPAHAGSRDVLWSIVQHCLDPSVADYCSTCLAPVAGSSCAAGKGCRETLQVWAENRDYVAFRDRKMCDCPSGFVHGLALPRAKVTGVEDPNRPDGIWKFAWTAAGEKMGNDPAAALVVNPAGMRDQDQLHVHIMRLKKDARASFPAGRQAYLDNLDDVWWAAGSLAKAAGLSDYGVLVTRRPGGGFIVLVDPVSPEKKYGIVRCLP